MAVPVRKEGISVEFQPMSPEEVQRTMQFLLQSQAQFEANFARFSEKSEADFARLSEGLLGVTALANQTERKVQELADSVGTIRGGLVGLTGVLGRVSERVEQLGEGVDRRLDQIAEVQHRQAQAAERFDRRLDRLEKSQERTDREIKATGRQIKELATLFKRRLREDHGRRRP